MLKACPATSSMLALGQEEGLDQVLDEQHVAHLLAVAVEGDRPALRARG